MKNTMNLQGVFQNLKNNPMINLIRFAQNPEQQAIKLIEQNMGNNPLMKNVLDLAMSGNGSQLEVIARNMLSEVGLDPDKAYNEINSFFHST